MGAGRTHGCFHPQTRSRGAGTSTVTGCDTAQGRTQVSRVHLEGDGSRTLAGISYKSPQVFSCVETSGSLQSGRPPTSVGGWRQKPRQRQGRGGDGPAPVQGWLASLEQHRPSERKHLPPGAPGRAGVAQRPGGGVSAGTRASLGRTAADTAAWSSSPSQRSPGKTGGGHQPRGPRGQGSTEERGSSPDGGGEREAQPRGQKLRTRARACAHTRMHMYTHTHRNHCATPLKLTLHCESTILQ